MSKTVAYCALIAFLAVVGAITASAPAVLSDNNGFLKVFVADGLLGVLGVILAITLASAGQLHLTLNQIEEKHNKRGFGRMRASIKTAANMLIVLFVAAILLVVAKPMMDSELWQQSLFNGLALFILLWNVLLLIALTQGIFAIKSEIKDNPN